MQLPANLVDRLARGQGLRELLACRGHRPESTRNRLDLPDPLGPITRTDLPGGTEKVSSRTRGVPSGALSATLGGAGFRV